ncbi:MAG: threonylcarbamoyl-AMP synthase, partial [Lachnospiraceae bacterium]|nr:threonylcarbamoyl-AMP synthase [Lachnospiraceae bacterium]
CGVKLLALRCAGFNNVDLKHLGNIRAVRVPQYSPYAVAEHATALLLNINRKIYKSYQRVKKYNFALEGLVGFDLHGKTVGVVGTGKIGKVFIQIMKGFGTKVIAYDLFKDEKAAEELGFEYVSFDELCEKSDIISLHCPLTPETEHIINKKSLDKMKEGVIIINCSRGGLINTDDLIAELSTGKIGGVGLDVYEHEEDYFLMDMSGSYKRDKNLSLLISMPNVIITAHQAFFTSEALNKIAAEIPEEAKMLADAFWPGPLTMIFQKTDLVPMGTTGGLNTVAVRMPDHPVALALIRAAGGYIAAPSANTSGRPSPTCAAHVQEDLDGRIEMILDGGPVGIGLESTIVDLSEGVPTILRPGYINQQMLEEVIGKTEIDRAILSDDSGIKPKAPGMKYRHYAPKASLTIVEGEQEKVTAKINELLKEGEAAGEKIGVIASTETAADYLGGIVRTIGSRSDELSISRHLFGILRDFDTLQVDRIYSESFETPQMGQAIMNRLMKAAGHQVMEV